MQQGANVNTIKENNNRLILNLLRRRAVSRAELAKLTGLSKSSVSILIKQLLDQGRIREIGTETTRQGRYPILLDLAADYRYACGISLHRREIAVCAVNLKAEALETRRRPVSTLSSPESAMDWALGELSDILKKHGVPAERCIGISISAPGPLDYRSGAILTPPNFELFHHFRPIAYLSQRCAFPVVLNNAPVLMAMYEQQTRETPLTGYQLISVDNGVGSAIVQNGEIFRGSNGFSGELGHMSVDLNGLPCSCGNRGCLERYITRQAVCERFGLSSYEQMIDRAAAGDESSLKIVRYIAEYFSAGIINAANLLDLEAVIIHGELNYRSELLFSEIQRAVDRQAIVSRAHPIRVYPSAIPYDSGIEYTAAAILQQYYDQQI